MPIYEASLVQSSGTTYGTTVETFEEVLRPPPPFTEYTGDPTDAFIRSIRLAAFTFDWFQVQTWVEFADASAFAGREVNLKFSFQRNTTVGFVRETDIAVSALCLPRGNDPTVWHPELLELSQDWRHANVVDLGKYTIDYGNKVFIMNEGFNPVFCLTSDRCRTQQEPSFPDLPELEHTYGISLERALYTYELEVKAAGDAIWHGDPF